MKLTLTKSVQLLLLFIIPFLTFVISVKILTSTTTSTTNITVDVNRVLSDVSNNPVGINMNFLRDKTNISDPLKNINIGSLRYPIGEIADYYLFDKDNPAKPKISVRDSNHWYSKLFNADDGTWKNPLTFDDFMGICKSVEAEPFIVVGIDAIAYTGTAPHANPEEVLEAAVDWVRYANIVKGYGIKYWEIGNETDLSRERLNWTAEDYAKTVVKFSRAMKAVDPSIKIGANGMSGLEWWDQVVPIIKDDVDFLVTHQFSNMKSYDQWKDNIWDLASHTKEANKVIKAYNPNLRINITAISANGPGTHRNNTWKMLHNFELLGNNILFNRVDYYHFWVTRWFNRNPYSVATSAFDPSYKLMPMGYPLKVWGNFLKKKMVSSSKSGKIRSWASYDPDDKSLNVFLLNKDEVSQDVSITLDNYTGSTQNERWVLKGSTPESTDVTWEKSGSVSVSGSKIKTTLEPLSVTVIALQGK